MPCSEKKLEGQRLRRLWLKEHHICIQCGTRDAAINMVRCPECLEYQYNRAVSKEKHNEYARTLRAKKKEQGICIYCTNPVQSGYAMCSSCIEKKKTSNKKYKSYKRKYTDEELYQVRSENGKKTIHFAWESPKSKVQKKKFREQNQTMYG